MSRTQREDWIRELAYRIWEARGRQPGGALDDWLAAERQVDQPAVDGPPIKVPNPPEVESASLEAELTKVASRDAPGG
jgi:hypothetical protein